jgi:hypothetical protein
MKTQPTTWTIELELPNGLRHITYHVGSYEEARAWAQGTGFKVLAVRED